MGTQNNSVMAAERIEEFKRLSSEFEELGGDPSFLRYAWGLSLTTMDPTAAAEDFASRRKTGLPPEALRRAQNKAREFREAIKALGPRLGEWPVFAAARRLLPGIERELHGALAVVGGKPVGRGRHTVYPRRHAFFGALWPYMEARAMGAAERRRPWLDDWFAVDDVTVPTDAKYFIKALEVRGGPSFEEITSSRFQIRPPATKSPSTKAWWEKAKVSPNPFARQNVHRGVDAFFLWARFIRRPEPRPSSPGLSEDKYVRCAWAFLRDEFGVRDIDDIAGVLLERISTGMFGMSVREQRAAIDRAINTKIGG